MSYLHPEASELEFGVVKVGNNNASITVIFRAGAWRIV